jgi:hypothetical protein
MTNPSQITDDTPPRLARAAVITFPDGSMSASGLLVEADRGRLLICRIAGKDYTILANIRRMIDQCPRDPKVRGVRSALQGGVAIGELRTPAHGSSAVIVDTRKALAAAMTIAKGLSRPSPTISSVSRSRRRPRKNVMPLQSRSPTFVDGRANAMMAWSRVPWELAGDVDAQG